MIEVISPGPPGPPVEWVRGFPDELRLALQLASILTIGVGAGAVVYAIGAFVELTFWQAWAGSLVITVSVGAVVLWRILQLYPPRIDLGLSPAGLVLVDRSRVPSHIPWGAVTVGGNSMTVDPSLNGGLSQSYRLTEEQTLRLARFLRPPAWTSETLPR